MDLSILIVNWNSKDYLRKCLESIYANQDGMLLEIIVVDAGSFDGCDVMLKDQFPEVLFIQSRENVGFGAANNLGFQSVTGENLLILNPDTEIGFGSLKALSAGLNKEARIGILGPRLVNTDGSFQDTCVRAAPTPLNRALDCELFRALFPESGLWGLAGVPNAKSIMEVEAVSGACMMIRGDIFREAGGFSSQFFMYGEDMDLCAKVRRMGLGIFYEPNVNIVHHGGRSSRAQTSRFTTTMLCSAAETFMRLNRGRMSAFCFRALMIASAIARLSIMLLIGPLVLLMGKSRSLFGSLCKWWTILIWCISINRR